MLFLACLLASILVAFSALFLHSCLFCHWLTHVILNTFFITSKQILKKILSIKSINFSISGTSGVTADYGGGAGRELVPRGTSDATSSSSLIVSLFMMSFDDLLHFKNGHIRHSKITRDQRTYGRTYGLTDGRTRPLSLTEMRNDI